MHSQSFFRAPWGTALKLITASFILLLAILILIALFVMPREKAMARVVMIGMPALILIISLLYMVQAYELRQDRVIIKRPFYNAEIPLQNLSFIEFDPNATSGSIRTFGNGGLFSFSGRFRNKKLGAYRAFATDFKHTVVLRTPDGTFVVTPDDPQRFISEIQNIQKS